LRWSIAPIGCKPGLVWHNARMTVERSNGEPARSGKTKRASPHTPPSPGRQTVGLLEVQDVAELLRTSPAHVRNLRSAGRIPAGKKIPGLGLRWGAAAFHQWIEAQTAEEPTC